MAGLLEAREQMVGLWGSLDRGRKIQTALVLVAALLLLGSILVLTRPQYEVLFANLTPQDAGEITLRLEELGVPFQLGGRGDTLLVPQVDLYQIRNQLVMEGFPRGGVVDFGIFNETRLGMTEFERRVQYRRALQGELTRTITAMAGVRNAWVQINIPEPRLYQSMAQEASAAILLDTTGEVQSAQVRGIVNLVAHSVEGLNPEQVTVVDTRGQVLSQDVALDGGLLGLTSSQLDLQRQIERELEQGLRSMLEMIIGSGRVVTRVRAELNFDQREVTAQIFEPLNGEGIVRSMQELERTFRGDNGGVGGVPGTQTNLPPVYQEGQGGQSEYFEREVTTNFDISEIREHTKVAPGKVERLSVAVLIDEGDLTLDQRLAVEETVATAVGIDYGRGDQITVTSLPFVEPPFAQWGELVDADQPGGLRWYHYVLGGIVALLGVGLLGLLRRRRLYGPGLEQQAAFQDEGSKTEPVQQQLLDQVERLARQRPETVAQLLSTWLAEDEG